MLKLKKYFKPFLVGFLLAIVLLFTQAMCDLNLPNYMSDIVNVGIQQGGIEDGSLDVISENGFNFIKSFLNADDAKLLADSYSKVSSDKYKDEFKNAGSEVYELNELSEEERDELNSVFGRAAWSFIYTMQSMGGAGTEAANAEAQLEDIDMAEIYKMQPQLDMIPAETKNQAIEKAAAMDDYMLQQTSTVMASAFYRELGADTAGMQSSYILKIGLKMLGVAFLSGLCTVLVSLISSRIAAGVARNLRREIFSKVESFSSAEFDKFSTASLITRSTNDIMQIQMVLAMGIRMICYAPIMGIGGVIMALNKAVSMGWVIAVAVVFLLGVVLVLFATVLPRFKAMQKLVDRLNLVSREILNGLMVIKAFGTREHEKKRFAAANADLTDNIRFVNRVMSLMMPVMMLIMNGISLLIVWVGANEINAATMQVGDMMAFMQYAMQIIMSFLMVAMMFVFIPRASVSASRIAEVLYTEPTIFDPEEPKPFDESKKGVVEFKNVSFKYSGAEENVLNNIDFTARPGETTAIIGATGSGKSTLINLIPRFYDATEGEILVDGVNIKDVRQKDLRKKIGFVPQKAMLLSGTISENIKYGDETMDDATAEKAAEVAQAIEFIGEKEDGMRSYISYGATNVSGGQKQRLSIARALAIKPEIYIFDDSFSALDFKTDAKLRAALKEYTADATTIIITQRVSTIMNAEQILVLDNGRIIGRGRHEELLRSCPEYLEIAESQLGEEAVKNVWTPHGRTYGTRACGKGQGL